MISIIIWCVGVLQVISRCREVGDPEGDYHYQVADMADMNATQMLIEVSDGHHINRHVLFN